MATEQASRARSGTGRQAKVISLAADEHKKHNTVVMTNGISHRPWARFLMVTASTIVVLGIVAGVVAAVILISDDTDDPNSIPVALTTFIEEAKAGNIASAEVDGQEIEFRLIDDPQTFRTKMEKGDTVRQILQDAGIEPEDFPPTKLK